MGRDEMGGVMGEEGRRVLWSPKKY